MFVDMIGRLREISGARRRCLSDRGRLLFLPQSCQLRSTSTVSFAAAVVLDSSRSHLRFAVSVVAATTDRNVRAHLHTALLLVLPGAYGTYLFVCFMFTSQC